MNLFSDLHDLTTSSSKHIFMDIVVIIDGDTEGAILTNKLAVYLLYPYLMEVLPSVDMIIIPPLISKEEKERTIGYLQFEIKNFRNGFKLK